MPAPEVERLEDDAEGQEREEPIEQYEHEDKQRANDPRVGLVTPETDRDAGTTTSSYDPQVDPRAYEARPCIAP